MALNGLAYLKNVGKSFGYATVDIFKEAMPTVKSMTEEAKEFSSDLYESIQDFKGKAVGFDGQDGFLKDIKDAIKDTRTNFISDIKTGKWYNKQRINEREDADTEALFGSFDEDFNFDFEFEDDTPSDSSVSMIDAQTDVAVGISKAVDEVGQRTAGAISMATAQSAEYVVQATTTGMNALYGLNATGFDNMNKGMGAINANLSTLVQLAEPLTAHMQNSATFYTQATEYQNKSLQLLEKIAENTSPNPANNRRMSNRRTLDSFLTSDGALNFREFATAFKEGISTYTDMIKMAFESMGGIKGAGHKLSNSPAQFLASAPVKALIGTGLRKGMKNFNENLSGFFGALLSTIRDREFQGPAGSIVNVIKSFILPGSRYNNKMDPGRYEKGKVDWDGISRMALINVIPTQLGKILSALTGREEERFNYDTGRWVKVSSIKEDWKNIRDRAAKNATFEYTSNIEDVIRKLLRSGQITHQQADNLKKQVSNYTNTAFHSNNEKYRDIMQDDFDYESFGMDREGWEFLRSVNRSFDKNKKAIRTNLIKNITTDRDKFGADNERRALDSSYIGLGLYNGSIDEDQKTRTLLGVDDYGNDLFYYLQGIYQNTMHVSENLGVFVPNGTKIKGVNIKPKGQIKPIGATTGSGIYIPESARRDIDKKYTTTGTQNLEEIQIKDMDAIVSAVLSDDNKIDLSKLSPDLVEYVEQRRQGLVEEDEEKEKRLAQLKKTSGLLNDQIDSIKKKAKGNPIYAGLIAKITDILKLPSKVGTDLLNALEVSMRNVLYGEGPAEGEVGIFGYLSQGMKSLFDKLDQKVENIFKFKPSDLIKKAWDKLAGKKGKDGRRTGGKLSGFVNATNDSLRDVEKWIKSAFTDGFAANGRRVTKTGLVAVSEGELIIPAELNPFYRGRIDKKEQYKKEHDAARRFFGFFKDGGSPTERTGKAKIIQFPGTTPQEEPKQENANGDLNGEGAGRTTSDSSFTQGKVFQTGKEFFKSGVTYMGSFLKETFEKATERGKTIYADRFGNSAMVVDENEEEGIKKLIDTGMKEAGVNKGAMGAGALIGAGVSILTGAFVGPILGAGIGAAAGLVIKSKKVQDLLFGNDEKKGLVPKNISEFVKKQLPNTAKGAVLGGTAGLFLGSPVLGMILGSAAGYISASDKAKRFLFGDEENDDGIIKKKTQEMIKQRIPGISAGTILGLLAGPFGSPIMNLAVGSVVGYAATGDQFHKWLFGEEGTDNKGFVGMIKENFFNPLIGIFDKLAESMRHTIRASFNNVGKTIRKLATDWFKGTVAGRVIKKAGQKVGGAVDKVVKSPFRWIGSGLNALNTRMEESALEKGYRVRGEDGKYLTAEQRIQRRKDLGIKSNNKFNQFDELLAGAESSDQLAELQGLVNQMIDPTKAYDNQIRSARSQLRRSLRGSNIGANYRDRIYKLAADGKYDQAIERVIKSKNIDETEKQQLIDQINQIKTAYQGRRNAKINAKAAKRELVNNTGLKGMLDKFGIKLDTLNDEQLRSLAELTGDQVAFKKKQEEEENTPEKKIEKAVTSDIPQILNDIAEILAGNRKKRDQYKGTTSKQEEEQQAKEDAEVKQEANKPEDGETVIQFINGKPVKYIYNSANDDYDPDMSSSNTKDALEEQEGISKGLSSLANLGKGIKGLFGKIGRGIFGEEDEDEEGKRSGGLVGSILEFFTGNGKFNLGAILGKVLKGALIAAGIWGLMSGKFDNLGKTLGISSSGMMDKGTYTGENGEILVKEGNKYINQETGEEYNGFVTSNNDASFSTRHASLAEKAKYNLVRGTITGKGSVIGTLAKQIPGYKAVTGKIKGSKAGQAVADYANKKVKSAGKSAFKYVRHDMADDVAGAVGKVQNSSAFKKAADAATNSTFLKTISEALSKFATMLTKVPVIKNVVKAIDLDKMIQTILEHCQKNIAKVAAKIGLDGISAAIPVLNAVFFVTDFMSGFNNANSILKIANKPSFGQKIVCGLLEAIKGLIPIVGSLIPSSILVDIFMNFVAPALGIDVSELKKDRDEAQEQLDAYNKEHGTDLTWDEYNKKVLGNQGILEKAVSGIQNVGNAIGSGVHNVVTGVKKVAALPLNAGKALGKSLKERGVLGTAQDIGKWFIEANKGLDDLVKKGKFKEFLEYDSGTEDPIFRSVQTVPLTMMKLNKAPGALLSTAFHTVKNVFTTGFENIATNFKSFETAIDIMNQKALDGKPGEVFNTKINYGANKGPLTVVYDGLLIIAKLLYGIVGTVMMIANPIVEFLKHPVKSIKKVINTILWGSDGNKKVDEDTSTDIEVPTQMETTPVSSGASQADQEAIQQQLDAQQQQESASGSGFVSQLDRRYANMKIGRNSIAEKGCGPASAVMALSRNGKNISMREATNLANHYQTGAGTDIRYFGDIFNRNGMDATYYFSGGNSMVDDIRSGRPVVLMGQDPYNTSKRNSPFGPNNHYVVANGMDRNGNIIVNDPESTSGSHVYSSRILRSVKAAVSAGMSGLRRRFSAGDSGQYPHTVRKDKTTILMWNFFRAKGYSEAATAGILGNAQAESGIDPTRIQSGAGHAAGMFQWESYKNKSGRWKAMADYAASKGKDWTDLMSQLEYAHKEIQGLGSYFRDNCGISVEGFMQESDPVQAAVDFEAAFERAGKPHLENRKQYAQQYFDMFKGTQVSDAVTDVVNGDASSLTATASTSTGTNNLNETTSTEDSSSSTSDSIKSLGVLGAITSAFSKIGNFFNGGTEDEESSSSSSSDTSSEDVSSTTNSSSSTTGTTSTTGVTNANAKTISFNGTDPVSYMEGILGKIEYSMKGARNPEKGSADCSSTVQWAIKKAGGPDIGGNTAAQYNDEDLTPVWYNNGQIATEIPTGLKRNDVLFFRREGDYTKGRQDRVGHVGLYMGNNKFIDHGSGMGPKIKDMKPESDKLIKVSRITSMESASGSGLYDPSAKSRLILYNDHRPIRKADINKISYERSAGESGTLLNLPTTGTTRLVSNNNNKYGISKDTAAMLQLIITLVEQIVKNTKDVSNIYSLLTNYCQNMLGAQGTRIAQQMQQNANNDDDVEKTLSSLKETMAQILAS